MTWVVGLRSQAGPIEDSTIRNTSGNFLVFFFFFEIFGFMFAFFIEMHYSSQKKKSNTQ